MFKGVTGPPGGFIFEEPRNLLTPDPFTLDWYSTRGR